MRTENKYGFNLKVDTWVYCDHVYTHHLAMVQTERLTLVHRDVPVLDARERVSSVSSE